MPLVESIDPSSQAKTQAFVLRGSSAQERFEEFWAEGESFTPTRIPWFWRVFTTSKGEVQTNLTVAYSAPSGSSVWLHEISANGRRFLLRWPISPRLFFEDAVWFCESEILAILAFGRSEKEAVQSFLEDFVALWDAIAQAPDKALTTEALNVKRAFQRLVKKEVPQR